MRAVLSLLVTLLLGNIRVTLMLVSLVGYLAWRWKSGLDEHLARQEILRNPTYAIYHSAVDAQGGSLFVQTMVYVAIALLASTLIILVAKAFRARKLRRTEEQATEVAEDAKFDSEMEAMAIWQVDAAKAQLCKQAKHLERDCDCSTNQKVWGNIDGGPIRWDLYREDGEIVGIIVSREEFKRLFPTIGYMMFEHVGEALCASDAPHYWMAVEEPGVPYNQTPNKDLIVRRPSHLLRSSRKRKSTKVEAN